MLQNNPELLTLPDTDPEETKFQVTDDLLAQVWICLWTLMPNS